MASSFALDQTTKATSGIFGWRDEDVTASASVAATTTKSYVNLTPNSIYRLSCFTGAAAGQIELYLEDDAKPPAMGTKAMKFAVNRALVIDIRMLGQQTKLDVKNSHASTAITLSLAKLS